MPSSKYHSTSLMTIVKSIGLPIGAEGRIFTCNARQCCPKSRTKKPHKNKAAKSRILFKLPLPIKFLQNGVNCKSLPHSLHVMYSAILNEYFVYALSAKSLTTFATFLS